MCYAIMCWQLGVMNCSYFCALHPALCLDLHQQMAQRYQLHSHTATVAERLAGKKKTNQKAPTRPHFTFYTTITEI